jgi:hypothetical protein
MHIYLGPGLQIFHPFMAKPVGISHGVGAVGLVGRVGCARDVRDALVQSGSSGGSVARGTCGAQRKRGVCAYVCMYRVS